MNTKIINYQNQAEDIQTKESIKIYKSKDEIDISKLRAWMEIDLSKFKNNLNIIKDLLNDDVDIIAIVKADAYGCGACVIGNYLQSLGVKHFAVASIDEAITLRKSGVKGEIIILGWTPPCQKEDLIKYNLCQTLVDNNYAKQLNDLDGIVRGYVKINTGMNRLGEPKEHLNQIKEMYALNNIKIEGIFSHLCRSDSNLEEDILFTKKQIDNFNYILNNLKSSNIDVGKVHLQNSYGIINYSDLHYNLARPGIILYGVGSEPLDHTLDKIKNKLKFELPISLRCKVAMVKEIHRGDSVGYGNNFSADDDMKVATITIGYADGLSRLVSKKDLKVLVNGKFAREIGNVCMDQTMIDVTGIDVKAGDVVTLIGKDKDKYLPINQISLLSDTIINETLCSFNQRVNRLYHL